MQKILKTLRWLTAVGTLLVLPLFAWQCIDIYLTGNSPANLDKNGVYIQNVYRMEDIVKRLSQFALPLTAYCVLLLLSVAMHMIFGQEMAERHAVSLKKLPYVHQSKAVQEKAPHTGAFRVVLCGLAVLFIVLGVMNGGWYDVLVKAINICTECIGLG